MARKKNVSLAVVPYKPIITEVSAVAKVAPRRRRRNKRRGRKGAPRASGAGGESATQSYMRSLTDPLNCAGPRLGWGCLQPTNVVTAYLRGSLTSASDGSLIVAALPDVEHLLAFNNGTYGVASWSTTPAGDLAAIDANYSAGRVISLGLRVYPDIALTSVPGVCLTGALPSQSISTLEALTVGDLMSFPMMHVSRGLEGGYSAGRPEDSTSFNFWAQMCSSSGFTASTTLPFSIPIVAFSGLPASTVVYYEVALNMECLFQAYHGSAPLNNGNSDQAGKTLVDEWPTLEKMWTTLSQSLPFPGSPGLGTPSGNWTIPPNAAAMAGRAGLRLLNARYSQNRMFNALSSVADTFLSIN